MKVLRALAAYGLVNTGILWAIIGMNIGSTITYPSKGLVAWTLINTLGVIITQMVSLVDSAENDG